jgi:hypothetical protein
MSRPRFKMRKTEDPGQDPHWQDVTLPSSWQHLRPVPYKWDSLQQVSASHEKSPLHMTSLRPAQAPPTPTEAWVMTRGVSLVHERLQHDAWVNDSPRHANAPTGGPCKQSAPTRALMRVCPAAQPSHLHHIELCHTQALPEALKHPLRRALD